MKSGFGQHIFIETKHAGCAFESVQDRTIRRIDLEILQSLRNKILLVFLQQSAEPNGEEKRRQEAIHRKIEALFFSNSPQNRNRQPDRKKMYSESLLIIIIINDTTIEDQLLEEDSLCVDNVEKLINCTE